MDAHLNEYLGAVAGMARTYGKSLPAVGDWVNGVTAGKAWAGYVLSAEPGRIAVECGGAWIVVPETDLAQL
jgi:hypothetical protein